MMSPATILFWKHPRRKAECDRLMAAYDLRAIEVRHLRTRICQPEATMHDLDASVAEVLDQLTNDTRNYFESLGESTVGRRMTEKFERILVDEERIADLEHRWAIIAAKRTPGFPLVEITAATAEAVNAAT